MVMRLVRVFLPKPHSDPRREVDFFVLFFFQKNQKFKNILILGGEVPRKTKNIRKIIKNSKKTLKNKKFELPTRTEDMIVHQSTVLSH